MPLRENFSWDLPAHKFWEREKESEKKCFCVLVFACLSNLLAQKQPVEKRISFLSLESRLFLFLFCLGEKRDMWKDGVAAGSSLSSLALVAAAFQASCRLSSRWLSKLLLLLLPLLKTAASQQCVHAFQLRRLIIPDQYSQMTKYKCTYYDDTHTHTTHTHTHTHTHARTRTRTHARTRVLFETCFTHLSLKYEWIAAMYVSFKDSTSPVKTSILTC